MEVVVVLLVNVTVNYGLTQVEEEEHGNHGETESSPVSSQGQVQETISLEGGEGMVEPVGRRLLGEWGGLLPKTLNVLIDIAFQLSFDLSAFDELDHLLLLLIGGAVLSADLSETQVDIVVETLTHF